MSLKWEQELFFGLLDNDSCLKHVVDNMLPNQLPTHVATSNVAVLINSCLHYYCGWKFSLLGDSLQVASNQSQLTTDN
jgi:hypothetical protein